MSLDDLRRRYIRNPEEARGTGPLVSQDDALAPIRRYHSWMQNRHDIKAGLAVGTAIGVPLALFLLVNGAPQLALVALVMGPAIGGAAGRARRGN